MKWITLLVFCMVAIEGVYLQCFIQNANSRQSNISRDFQGITNFGMELFKQFSPAQSSENFFFSPYSIWTALILTYFGSAGNTQQQLGDALGISDKISAYHIWRDLEDTYSEQSSTNPLLTFNVANRAYIDQTMNVKDCIKSIFREELRIIDFLDVARAATDINDFVSRTTAGHIKDLVTQDDLQDIIMALVNAAFFKGTWKFEFDPSDTYQAEFSIGPQRKAVVTMMNQTAELNYGVSERLGARVLEVPYAGDTMSMILLLPNSDRPFGDRFVNMVNNLNGDTLRDAIDLRNMSHSVVYLQLPKIKFSNKIRDEFKTGLQNLGITEVFIPGKANLSEFDPKQPLFLDTAIHEAFIAINEEGTEAAAATALLFATRITGAPKIIQFTCNEPFLFMIVDKQARNVLFMGALKNPLTLE